MTCAWKERAYNIGCSIPDETRPNFERIKSVVCYAWNTTLSWCLYAKSMAELEGMDMEQAVTVKDGVQVWLGAYVPYFVYEGDEVARYATLKAVQAVTEKFIWAHRRPRPIPKFMTTRGFFKIPDDLCSIEGNMLHVEHIGDISLCAAPQFHMSEISGVTLCWYANGATDVYFIKRDQNATISDDYNEEMADRGNDKGSATLVDAEERGVRKMP